MRSPRINDPEIGPPEAVHPYFDDRDNPLNVGDVVLYGGEWPEDAAFLNPNHLQTVVCRIVEFTDWDGDMDEWGRTVGYPPKCIVEFPDGLQDELGGFANPDGSTRFDDVRLAVS